MLEVIALYFADIVFNLRVLLIIFAILAFILIIIDIVYGDDDIEDEFNEKAYIEEDNLFNDHDKVRFWIIVIFTILVSGAVFLPSKEFILKMYGM